MQTEQVQQGRRLQQQEVWTWISFEVFASIQTSQAAFADVNHIEGDGPTPTCWFVFALRWPAEHKYLFHTKVADKTPIYVWLFSYVAQTQYHDEQRVRPSLGTTLFTFFSSLAHLE